MRSNYSKQSDSFERRRKRRTVIGIVSGVVAIATWLFIFSTLSSLSSLQIIAVKVYGADRNESARMESAAYQALQGTYLGIFNRANTFIYPKGSIKAAIASTSPRVSSITVSRSGLTTLAISVLEKTPDAAICADLPDLTNDGVDESIDKCYAADEKGYIFRKLQPDEPKDINRYYLPDISEEGLIGSQATSTDIFKTIQSFVTALKNANIHVISTLIKGGGEYEVYATNPDSDSIVVIHANDKGDLQNERENLIAFWQKMVSVAHSSHKTVEWNEIKLQYPPNVYYTETK